jgi:hypothetical protein
MAMTNHRQHLAIAVASLVLAACGGSDSAPSQAESDPASATNNGLVGAWRIAEYNSASGTAAANPAGLFVFSTGQYSIMYANAATPRTPFADPDTPTDVERVNAFNTIVANAGDYELAGDTLIVRPVISKHPGYMGGGEDRFVTRVTGDTLWLTEVAGAFRWAGGRVPADTSSATDSFKLVRAR